MTNTVKCKDSETGETPNQRVKRDAENRQGKCVRAHLSGRWRDLIGQLEYGLEALIGWEAHARSQARTNGRSRTFYYEVADACVL